MKNPIDIFFKLGDIVTKGEPQRKADFDYYMMWIIFLAFIGVFVGNIWEFISFQKLANLGWGLFACAILWFQYHNLVAMRQMRMMLKGKLAEPKMKIESEEEMMKQFEEVNKNGKPISNNK